MPEHECTKGRLLSWFLLDVKLLVASGKHLCSRTKWFSIISWLWQRFLFWRRHIYNTKSQSEHAC